MRNNFHLQFDLLTWQFSKIYRPKALILLLGLGLALHLCGKPDDQRKAQILVMGARSAEPWQYRYKENDLNEAIELAGKLPEAYAARGNLYHRWSNFLEEVKTDERGEQISGGSSIISWWNPYIKETGFKTPQKFNSFYEVARKKAEGFDFDLSAANSYRRKALNDYNQSLKLIKKTNNTKLQQEVVKARDCLQKREKCYAYIHFSKIY